MRAPGERGHVILPEKLATATCLLMRRHDWTREVDGGPWVVCMWCYADVELTDEEIHLPLCPEAPVARP
jgi:hypothetical protein